MLPSDPSPYIHYTGAFASGAFVTGAMLLGSGKGDMMKHSCSKTALCSTLVISYLIETVGTATDEYPLERGQSHLFYTIVFGLVWSTIALRKTPSWCTTIGTALITALADISLLVISTTHSLNHWRPILVLVNQSIRILAALSLLGASLRAHARGADDASPEEAQPFLQSQARASAYNNISYGTRGSDDGSETDSDETLPGSDYDSDSDDDGEDAEMKRLRAKKLKEAGGWLGYLKGFSILMPYLIPRRDRKVQACLLISLFTLAGKRALNILVPRQLGIVTDRLLGQENPYPPLMIWFVLNLVNSDSGLGLVEALAKIPIKQFSYRQIANASFSHVMNLSMDFHSERDSAEVMKAVEQGESLTNLMETAVIEILPTFVDLILAIGLLYQKFNIFVALAMLVATVAFITLEVFTSNWNIENRRKQGKAEREEAKVMHQAIQGWQTVTYFNMFGFERRRFGDAVDSHMTANKNWGQRDAYIQAILEAMVPITFFTLSALAIYEISNGRATPGDFVFLIQYWDYLIYPLQFLSHNYRYLMSDLVDAERLLDLLQTQPTIFDKEGARPLALAKGHVEFSNVFFAYHPKRPSVQGLSIAAHPGQTLALVGPTGAGKSTILKLLLRFYDVNAGQILIDGQDVQNVTLSSLRDAFGVVPQDPLLFNASIMENLRYARPCATDEEIFEACRAAAVHDKILTFPDGYQTKVGEQGVKLSGGEIQRLAIARVFLKNPPILILDEATSAVDTSTESAIQGALDALKKQRTTFLIAHRLSTVVNADQILVVDQGVVIEKGTHAELLREQGKYHELWRIQAGENHK